MTQIEFTLVRGKQSLPVHTQIRNHLEYAIGSGQLAPGARLPSVRELACDLNIAPNTVARVYQDLQNDGLLVTRSGQGTFVSELTTRDDTEALAKGTLRSILQPAMASAIAIGFSPTDIRNMTDELLGDRGISVGLVAVNQRLLDKWASIVTTELSEHGVTVIGLLLDELQQDLEQALARLGPAHHVFSLVNTFPDVRAILHPHGKKVSVLLSELSHGTQQALANLPPEGCVGVVCSDIYASSILGMMGSYVDAGRLKRVPSHDREAIRTLSKTSCVLVHTFDAQPDVGTAALPDVPRVPLDFVPEHDCFRHLAKMLREERSG
jgi:GntR family transcriptional regulator